MNLKAYKKASRRLSLLFLALALFAKFYTGPWQHIADAYFGDLFIVASLYYALSLLKPALKPPIKFSAIAALALLVELFQATGIPASLNLPVPFVFILGTGFDVVDFLYYFTGLALAFLLDVIFLKHAGKNDAKF